MKKLNTYGVDNNLNNMSENIDYNRLAYDGTEIDVDYTGSPAEVTIKKGSLIEVNGNLYTAPIDEDFTMALNTHNYIAFNGVTWASFATKGTYSAEKQGYYQADNISRTARWNIDQTEETFYKELEIIIPTDKGLSAQSYSKVSAYLSINTPYATGNTIVYDIEDFDTNSEYDNATGIFTALQDGFYTITANIFTNTAGSHTFRIASSGIYAQTSFGRNSIATTFRLQAGDTILVQAVVNATYQTTNAGGRATYMAINRIL